MRQSNYECSVHVLGYNMLADAEDSSALVPSSPCPCLLLEFVLRGVRYIVAQGMPVTDDLVLTAVNRILTYCAYALSDGTTFTLTEECACARIVSLRSAASCISGQAKKRSRSPDLRLVLFHTTPTSLAPRIACSTSDR